MFRMEKIRGGSSDCYGNYLREHLDYSDYVSEKEKVTGQWFGTLASEWEIEGDCLGAEDKRFRALCDSQHPLTGVQLTQRQHKDGIRFFDFQASSPKSVSVMAVTMDDARIVQAHKEAVDFALVELERFAAHRGENRNGSPRMVEITGKIIGARFTHLCARPSGGGPADPQLHTHCAVSNVTQSKDGRFWALTESEMVKAIRYAGKVYENELIRKIRALGYKVAEKRNKKNLIESFEISGVSEEICDRFSKRSHDVEKAIAQFQLENGREPTTAELRVIKRETRLEKDPTASHAVMTERQRAQLTKEELAQLEKLIPQKSPTIPPPLPSSEAEAVQKSVSHIFERNSVAPMHEVLAEALSENGGRLNLDALKSAARACPGLVNLVDMPSSLVAPLATIEGLEAEILAVNLVDKSRGAHRAYSPTFQPFGGVDEIEKDGKKLNVGDQRAAATGILRSSNRYIALRGVAGAGKTTVLKEIHKGFLEGGWNPVYLAPTTAARDVLKEEGFGEANTLQSFVFSPPALRPDTVLVVDEAGLSSNKLGLQLMREAERAGARILFVGDAKQHAAVEAGDFLRVLEDHSSLQRFELGKVVRQRHAEYRAAMQVAATGNSQQAVRMIDALGWVVEAREKYLTQAAKELIELRQEHGAAKVIGVAPTHEEGRAMTYTIRSELTARGLLAPEKQRQILTFDSAGYTVPQRRNMENYRPGQLLSVTTGKLAGLGKNDVAEIVGIDAEKRIVSLVRVRDGKQTQVQIDAKTINQIDVGHRRELPLAPGDAILITTNDKKNNLVNGDILTVEKFGAHGEIHTREGKDIPASWAHMTHGYVITSHKSQGRTVKHVVVAAAKLEARAAYVSLTRGTQSAKLFTPDKETLINSIPTTNTGRQAALDYKRPPAATSVASVLLPSPALPSPANPPTHEHANRVRRRVWHELVRTARRRVQHQILKVRRTARRYIYSRQYAERNTNRKNINQSI